MAKGYISCVPIYSVECMDCNETLVFTLGRQMYATHRVRDYVTAKGWRHKRNLNGIGTSFRCPVCAEKRVAKNKEKAKVSSS